MHAVIGALLLALAVVLFQFAYILHRAPAAKRWLRNELTSSLMCFVILIALAAGIASFAEMTITEETLTLANDGELLAVLAVLVVCVVAIRRRWRHLWGRSA